MNNRTIVQRFLCGHKFLFLWEKCLEVQFPGHMVSIFLNEAAKLFSFNDSFRVALPFEHLKHGVLRIRLEFPLVPCIRLVSLFFKIFFPDM